ncbi:MAG: sugar phosphate nucleotidyltransferase [Anaerolineae bacterium]|jgi:UTP--glucose-1-phosphate uridylyltransferase|nr:UTP--glucose-1-phosphate uridylyltransferase [Chloroflexota bacterium]
MRVTKAVITAAGRQQRSLPLQTLIDSDGHSKPILTILVEEVLRAGIEQVAVVVCPGDEVPYGHAVGSYASRITFVPQDEPQGYGHAIFCANPFTQGEPFLHLVSDHLPIARGQLGCAEDLVQTAQRNDCAVSAVQASRESLLPYFGAVGAKRVANSARLYLVERVLEKPTPTDAEQWLGVPGLRAGHYLCFFGMHVLTPAVMTILGRLLAATPAGVTLSDALNELPQHERYLALESNGRRVDVGSRYGILSAQVALALSGRDREWVLRELLELLATDELDRGHDE